MRNSLRGQITFILVALAAAPLLLVGLLLTLRSFNTQEQQALDLEHETALRVSVEINKFIEGHHDELSSGD